MWSNSALFQRNNRTTADLVSQTCPYCSEDFEDEIASNVEGYTLSSQFCLQRHAICYHIPGVQLPLTCVFPCSEITNHKQKPAMISKGAFVQGHWNSITRWSLPTFVRNVDFRTFDYKRLYYQTIHNDYAFILEKKGWFYIARLLSSTS